MEQYFRLSRVGGVVSQKSVDAVPHLRADAARNRERILCEAATLYASGGSDISLEEVARAAGVGVGTMYRRFPTKQALVEALFEGKMNAYAERSEQAAAEAETEPWEAFRGYLMFLLEEQAKDLAFSEVLRDPATGSELFRQLHRRALRASLSLVRSALAAGVLRPDFRHPDLLLITDANHGITVNNAPSSATASARFAALILDSLRVDPAPH